jgi:hypothetical protein
MNEQRQQAYLNLTRSLLDSPSGEQAEILAANQELLDAGFVQKVEEVAQMCSQHGDEKTANRLQGLGMQLREALNLDNQIDLQSLSEEERQEYDQFLMQVLQVTADSRGNAQVVYPLLAKNTDKLDGVLAEILRRWGTNTLGEAKADEVEYLAAVIVEFSNLIQQFPLGSKASNMEIAITGYEVALTVYTREALPIDWAMTQNNLGLAYSDRIRGDRADNIENAIAAFTAALTVRTREALPIDWAMTQNNLANAYRDRIKGDKADNIENAIAACTAALQISTRAAFPQDWARTQMNLGTAYSDNLRQVQTTEEGYLLQITQDEATGNELNIFLTAPGFQFNSDNTTSLPLDSDTININQTAIFNLTALRPGKTKIKAELYCGETYKTTLETEVEVTAFEETELRLLIAARSRPVPQPDIILQVRTTWNADISVCTFNYHIDSYQPRLLFADNVDYNSQSLSATWVERSHSLLKTTLEEAASSPREDFRSRLISLGRYLFQSLLPEELQNTFRTIASFNQPFTLLILADQDAWFPWELLHDGQKFLGDRFIIGRWLWELEKSRPYEFPVGAVNVAHYASVEQPELWTELLQSSGAPPPISMQAGIFNDITLFESIRGLHLIRYGQSVDTTNRQDAPVRVNSSSDIQNIEREVQPAKLSLRRNHPLVSLSYLNAGQPELTALEQTWASTFVRAGCSAFVGSLWAVQPNVEAAFVSAFYNNIWAGQTLGVAFQTARRLAKSVVPESLDWLAYVLFGDPMARPYRPVQGQGYAVVEPIGQEIDDPVSPGSTVRFRVSLRRTPPVWYENRLMEVAEDLTFDDLRVFIVTSGLQVTPGDSILMTRTATGDYLGWFTLTVPVEMESRSVLVQVYFEDGIKPVHNLRFALNIVKQDGEAQ